MMRPLLLPLIALAIVACSDGIPPQIQKGFDALDGAYATDVKPGDAAYTQCKYAHVGAHHVVRCGTSNGGAELANIGYWEIEPTGDAFALYAMNGKALAALARITRPGAISTKGYPGAFRSGSGRTPLDIPEAAKAFK